MAGAVDGPDEFEAPFDDPLEEGVETGKKRHHREADCGRAPGDQECWDPRGEIFYEVLRLVDEQVDDPRRQNKVGNELENRLVDRGADDD